MAQSAALLRIGTRGSPLALKQADEFRARFAAAHGLNVDAIEIRAIRTTGDAIGERPLAQIGGKGLFTKEIDQALIDNAIDVAVHSAKDMPGSIPPGLAIAAYLPREDARDAFISRKATSLRELARGAVMGTASPRRKALALRLRPDLDVVSLRGNVNTRLAKIAVGTVDATLLAMAGLKRLGLADTVASVLEVEEFLPAIGQGAIAVVARGNDVRTQDRLAAISDVDTVAALAAERAFLMVLEGSCRTPIAGHAAVKGKTLQFHGLVLRPDGSEAFEVRRNGTFAEAAALGADAGQEIKGRIPADFFGT